MQRTISITAAIVFFTVCPLYADYSVMNKGTWPDTWPKELEELREQSRTLEGPVAPLLHYAIPFTKRESFETAWPHLLKVKSPGAPIVLRRGPSFLLGKESNAGVCVHTPPKGQAPIADASKVGGRRERTIYIELIVDGEIVDLNRISLPPDTPIIDERFKNRGGDDLKARRAESPTDLPQERAGASTVSTRDHAALQGSWTLESIDGKRVENGRTITFDKDTVTGLFLEEEKTPRVLRFHLLAEDAVKGIDVGPQVAPNKDDGFKMRGIYELESDTLKLAFLPKLDARNPPPGLDSERRPKSFDPKLVRVWEFGKAK